MKIEYLFSKPKSKISVGGHMIRWASRKATPELSWEDTPSHVAVLMNDTLVVESTLSTGVHIIPYYRWLQKNIEIAKLPCRMKYRPSAHVFRLMMDVWDKPYDWFGILYFSWAFFKNIVFNERLKDSNPWQRDSHFFCTEFAARLTGVDLSMKTPAMLLHEWTQDES